MLLVTKTQSGSLPPDDPDAGVPVEDGSDILRECAGGCGQKILVFGPQPDDWGEGVAGAFCLECRSRPFKVGKEG